MWTIKMVFRAFVIFAVGGWPRFARRGTTTKSVAPRFVIFEAWAFPLPAS